MLSCSDKSDLILNFSEIVGYSCSIILTAWDKGVQWSYMQKETAEQCDWLEPERATLGIRIKFGNTMQIDQLKLHYNAEPSNHTKELIYNWIINENCKSQTLYIAYLSGQATIKAVRKDTEGETMR